MGKRKDKQGTPVFYNGKKQVGHFLYEHFH